MTKEELRDYVDEQRTLDNIPYHVYSTLIDGIDTLEQEPCDNCKYLDGDGCRLVFEQIECGKASDECPSDNNISTKNTVSRGAFEQVMWERDIAISQLKELGYEFGEKIESSGDSISRQAVHNKILVLWNSNGDKDYCMEILRDFVAELPPVKPQEPKTIQEKQAESEKYQKAFDDGYDNGYTQARFDYEQKPCEDVAKERYEDLCEYFGGAKDILKHREDFKAWLGRVKWHIRKAEELYEKYEYKKESCDDAISHDDRLIDLANAIESDDSGYWTNKRISSALKNISSVTQKSIECDDAISRQAVLDEIYESRKNFNNEFDQGFFADKIKALPSINPTKTGYWIETETDDPYWYRCSRCNRRIDDRENYCPSCGAKMD